MRYAVLFLLQSMLLFSLLVGCSSNDSEQSGDEDLAIDGDGEVAIESDIEHEMMDGDAESIAESDIEYDFHSVLPIPSEGSLADPHVIHVDGTWYLYGTHSQESFEVWYTDDLAHWEEGPTVWSPSLDWQTEGGLCGIWAPHVERAGNEYYLYYTANCRIGVARSDSPLGPFTEVYDHPLVGNGYGGVGDGKFVNDIIRDWDDMAIDAFVLQAKDGSLILYHNGFTPLSSIYAQRMDDFITVSGKPTLLLEPDVSSWEGFIREGSWVIEREGVYHLMYSGNMFDTIDYGIGVATATSPLGPFEKDQRNPILKTNLSSGVYAPGHHSVVPGAYGDRLIFYHTKISEEDGEGRLVRYGPLWFDKEGRVNVEQP